MAGGIAVTARKGGKVAFRFVPLILLLAVSPLVLRLYWMWRVRVRGNLRGSMIAQPTEARPLAG